MDFPAQLEQHMSDLNVLWQDGSELAVQDGDTVRRFSYVRHGNKLLLTDGYGYWTIALEGAGPRARPAGGAQGRPPSSLDAPADGRVTAQMPGKVMEVRVAEGDAVQAGDVLLVLEAMKMEHSLSAPCAGTVKRIGISAGDRVMPGDLLVEIEPA
jgi:biotin carboxyl carrier protein